MSPSKLFVIRVYDIFKYFYVSKQNLCRGKANTERQQRDCWLPILISCHSWITEANMSWIPRSRGLVVCGVALSASAATYLYQQSKSDLNKEQGQSVLPETGKFANTFSSKLPLGKVLASWTTNFEPSVKWDDNWDRFVYIS